MIGCIGAPRTIMTPGMAIGRLSNSDNTSHEACSPLRRPLVSLAMVYSFKFYIGAITLAVVGLSQPGW